ncbi:hypothetical protein DdX_15409 [Ditylenchus destructor]|uniref:Uncharacterized protein n=1 Tax=Ditylenchus destructor TaxID=166010 RepID=A0AAD4MQH8_9BILA|nr:hypothetical protein DdX_15409 [Ditylenchus destructor]
MFSICIVLLIAFLPHCEAPGDDRNSHDEQTSKVKQAASLAAAQKSDLWSSDNPWINFLAGIPEDRAIFRGLQNPAYNVTHYLIRDIFRHVRFILGLPDGDNKGSYEPEGKLCKSIGEKLAEGTPRLTIGDQMNFVKNLTSAVENARDIVSLLEKVLDPSKDPKKLEVQIDYTSLSQMQQIFYLSRALNFITSEHILKKVALIHQMANQSKSKTGGHGNAEWTTVASALGQQTANLSPVNDALNELAPLLEDILEHVQKMTALYIEKFPPKRSIPKMKLPNGDMVDIDNISDFEYKNVADCEEKVRVYGQYLAEIARIHVDLENKVVRFPWEDGQNTTRVRLNHHAYLDKETYSKVYGKVPEPWKEYEHVHSYIDPFDTDPKSTYSLEDGKCIIQWHVSNVSLLVASVINTQFRITV